MGFGLINFCGTQTGAGTGSLKWTTFFKSMVGTWNLNVLKWRIRFDINGFIYLINFKDFKIKLELSDMVRFPSLSGWFKFKYLNFWYYFRLVGKSLKIEWFKFGLTCKNMLDKIPILSNFCSQGTGSKFHLCDKKDKNGCQHTCVRDGDKAKCKCNKGFELQKDGKACAKQNYKFLGCLKDALPRAVPQIDGSDARIRGNYRARSDAINKCYAVARERGMRIFALQDGGWCAASKDLNGYKKYGKANHCRNMKGGGWANDVYLILNPKLNPCDEKTKGGCAQLCVKGTDFKYTCKCKTGFALEKNGQACKKVEMSPCTPWRQRYPVEAGARNHAICSSNGDPHPVTFDGQRFDYYKIGDWAMVQSDRRDFHVHARTHICWRVSCNCAVVVKEGQDVISVNYCGNRNDPFVGFLSKKEPLHGTGIEKSGRTYRIVMASGATVELTVNMNRQALWINMKITVPDFDFKHIEGLCGSWDNNRGNDGGKHTVEKWRRNRANSLFFYKAKGGDVCLSKKLLCNKGKKFIARGGWINYVFPGQTKCNKKREEKDDPNSEELPDKTNDPDAGLPKDPEKFKPVIPKWPTPTGKKEKDVKKHCEAKIKVSATYKSCRRVLGVRFSIKGAVEQCVADTLLTDSFEMSVPAALATMKTICLDVANDDEEKKINGETCPNDCNGNGKCIKGVCKCNAGFKAFDCLTEDKCRPFNKRFPAEGGAPGGLTRCTSNGDPHFATFDGKRYDDYRIGDWSLVKNNRRDFSVHSRTHKCWRVACNCGIVVKEGQDVISVNYCGNRNKPFVGFLSKKEPLHGTGIEKSGLTYRIVMASGAMVELRINMNRQALWINMRITVP